MDGDTGQQHQTRADHRERRLGRDHPCGHRQGGEDQNAAEKVGDARLGALPQSPDPRRPRLPPCRTSDANDKRAAASEHQHRPDDGTPVHQKPLDRAKKNRPIGTSASTDIVNIGPKEELLVRSCRSLMSGGHRDIGDMGIEGIGAVGRSELSPCRPR